MKFKKNIIAKFFLFAFLANILLLPSFVFAQNSTDYQEYEIKLSDVKFAPLLNDIGSSVNARFTQTAAPEFRNIYTFNSDYSSGFLKRFLAGSFIYLEPERQLSSEAVVPFDPGFTSNPQDIDKQWGLARAGFDTAWQKTTGSKTNIVAVIDTGIDQTHEDLLGITFVDGYDFTNKIPLPKGVNSDDNGHGTLVAGVLGATANNGRGIAGTNWQISLMPIKSLDASGKGDSAALAEGITWATDHGAQFLNLSIGGIGFGHDTALAAAISYAFNKNVLLVAAAGNDAAATGGNLDQNPVFPICDDNNFNMVIGVAATDQNDIKPEFSNYGRNCIDVSAPGKRILSTINFDPVSKRLSPNSYAYASGTSLAVPFVVGQAALIKALYPQATNIQIRDRIIATADPIDNLNLSQCGGSCRGLLGSGRINVVKSLEQAITVGFSEGDLVKVTDLPGAIYQISGGQKRLISPFVFNQRFNNAQLKQALFSQLASFPEGPYVTPLEGTLVKLDSSSTIYVMQSGQKLPITYQVFLQRNLSFSNANTLSFSEVNSWVTGSFLPPLEGTLIKSSRNKTVYWVVGQVLHPVNYNFFIDRGLNIFPIMVVDDNDIANYPKGEAYIR